MNKEVEKKLKELFELLNNEENNDRFLEDKFKFRKDANRVIDKSEKVIACMSEKDFIACGSIKNILYAIFGSLESMIQDNNVPRSLIVAMFDHFIRK